MKRILGILVSIIFVIFTTYAQPRKAPNFILKTADGKIVELAKLKGKAVVVNFWATWCGPCRAEIPDFIKIYESYKKEGLEIIGVSLDEDGWDAVKPYIEKIKINYPVVLGDMNVVQQYGGISAIPTTFFIDKKGNVVDHQVGMLSKSAIEEKVRRLLN